MNDSMGTKVVIGLEEGASEASPCILHDRYKRKHGINDTQAVAVRRPCGLFLETDFDYD